MQIHEYPELIEAAAIALHNLSAGTQQLRDEMQATETATLETVLRARDDNNKPLYTNAERGNAPSRSNSRQTPVTPR